MKTAFVFFCLIIPFVNNAQIITTIAGTGLQGDDGDGGMAILAKIGEPDGCAFDAKGNFYFTTVGNDKIRKVTFNGIISTIAGTGIGGYNGDSILATAAMLNTAASIAIDTGGNIFISDNGNNRVRKIDAITGIITTVAGNGDYGFSGDNGPATAATFNGINCICLDQIGDIFVYDNLNSRIRKIDKLGVVTTTAGIGIGGYSGDNGLAISSKIEGVIGMCVDNLGNLYLTQSSDAVIRKIDTSGIITTIAGNGLAGPSGDEGPATAASLAACGLVCDNLGNLFISGYIDNDVRKIDAAGIIHTIAGTGVAGFSGDGGMATSAQISNPYGIAIDTCGNIYIADKYNVRIRKVSFNPNCWPEDVKEVATNNIKIYPNPAANVLHIDGITQSGQVYKIINVIGTVLQQGTLKPRSNNIDINALADGMYMVEVGSSDEVKKVVKMIKQ